MDMFQGLGCKHLWKAIVLLATLSIYSGIKILIQTEILCEFIVSKLISIDRASMYQEHL